MTTLFTYSPQGAVYTDPNQKPASYTDTLEAARARDDLYRANSALQRAYATALATKAGRRDPHAVAEAEDAYRKAGEAAVEALSVLHAHGIGTDTTKEHLEGLQAEHQAAAVAAIPRPVYGMVKELAHSAALAEGFDPQTIARRIAGRE